VLKHILVPFALLANGLAAGDMFCVAIGIAPLMLALPYGRYVQLVHFLRPRYDPTMPVLNGVTVVLDVVLAVAAGSAAATALFGVAAALALAVIVLSVVKAVPINRYVMSLDPETCPADWLSVDPRTRWRNWNAVRTVLMVVALGVNGLAATLL
jgi:uncharacterized membrane protein